MQKSANILNTYFMVCFQNYFIASSVWKCFKFYIFKHVPEKNNFPSQTIPENRTRRPLVLGLLLLDKLFFLRLSLITNLYILAFAYDENSSF